jgi:AraC family transcriptional regulator, transcriptional activator of pobA
MQSSSFVLHSVTFNIEFSIYMKNQVRIESISELHRLMGIAKPLHPLVSLIKLDDVQRSNGAGEVNFILNFYGITLKRNVNGKLKYGQNYYDFDEGVLGMTAPHQIISVGDASNYEVSGWWLVFHYDFLMNTHLAKKIKEYGFFSYDVHEALHLSDGEETMLESIFKSIEQEYRTSIDHFSQDVMISQLELLMNYVNRFYNRQFLTRKKVNHDIVTKLDQLIEDYFNSDNPVERGIPSVQSLSEKLNLSPSYLSDMLKSLTGQTTLQHLHEKMIERAKLILSTTDLTVGEVAYNLGFEHSQSFSKFFKSKTHITPLQYRASFN